jgi:hypothetical protein
VQEDFLLCAAAASENFVVCKILLGTAGVVLQNVWDK